MRSAVIMIVCLCFTPSSSKDLNVCGLLLLLSMIIVAVLLMINTLFAFFIRYYIYSRKPLVVFVSVTCVPALRNASVEGERLGNCVQHDLMADCVKTVHRLFRFIVPLKKSFRNKNRVPSGRPQPPPPFPKARLWLV
jgi:hypothetical protein